MLLIGSKFLPLVGEKIGKFKTAGKILAYLLLVFDFLVSNHEISGKNISGRSVPTLKDLSKNYAKTWPEIEGPLATFLTDLNPIVFGT